MTYPFACIRTMTYYDSPLYRKSSEGRATLADVEERYVTTMSLLALDM